MLRLPAFDVVTPETVDGVVAALAAHPGARLVAGGTDLLPNLKHRLDAPPVLVSLVRVRALATIERDAAGLRLGAAVTLAELAAHPDVRAVAPSLARAAGLVASPSLRNMGTLGGTLHLDTRCRYLNQTALWRAAIGGGCLKSEGDRCHVVPGGQQCVAALSSDCVPVLITLGAEVDLVGPSGSRIVPLDRYYRSDGVAHVAIEPGEVMTRVRVPAAPGPRRATYAKWTVRASIDFPLISVALRFDLDADRVDARVTDAAICVGVLGAQPRRIRHADTLAGRALDDPATADALAALLAAQCRPLDNVPYAAAYRRKVIPVHARRALAALVAAG
jgi:4-hydroxybenzoyl-CoA reductase subunit beta